MSDQHDYDLAILHVVDAGPVHGRKVRLTRKAASGEIGHELVFEFDDAEALDDFIQQLRAVRTDAWGAPAPGAEDLPSLLDGITDENRHDEIDVGGPIGQEPG